MTLPDGALGKLLAVLLLCLGGAAVHAAAVAPLLAVHEGREQRLAEQRELAARFERAAAEIPRLRESVASLRAGGEGDDATLPGETDTVAAAGLQAFLRNLVARHGGSVESAEALPARPQEGGGLRRVGARIQTGGDVFLLVSILDGIETASPPLVVDTLQVRSGLAGSGGGASGAPDSSLSISLDVFGFRKP